mgnify:CR=1 FL=1
MDLNQKWQKSPIIAFDTETSGKYPLESELCEIAAVKWQAGKVVDEYQVLIKPSHKMSDEVIKIHNITNEMVENAPPVTEVIGSFYDFIQDSVLIAHHSPFDLGFLAIEFERVGLKMPSTPVLCSSIISRKAIPESSNHKLQTLVKLLKIKGGQAHRALDDARSALELALICFERIGKEKSLQDLFDFQEIHLTWQSYSLKDLAAQSSLRPVIEAIQAKDLVQITYQGGSRPGEARTVRPIGIVRNPNGDFLVAVTDGNTFPKRYRLDKITKSAY